MMNSGRVVLLVRNVVPEYYGGGETYQLMLASELRKNDFVPVIVTSSIKLLEEAKKQGIEAVKCPFLRQQNWSGWRNIILFGYWVWQMRLRKWYGGILKEYCPAVVNIQSRDDWLAATVAAKRMGARVLWTDHTDFRCWVLQNVNVKYKNLIGKKILKMAREVERVIFVSDYERKSFEKIVKPRKYDNLITVKNGVSDKYEEYERVKVQRGSFCYIGRIVEYKGIGELIKAFMIVNKKYPETELNIYGEGDDMMKYRELADSNRQIKFYGRTDRPLEAMAKNEIFVLPSYWEGLSLSMLDAVMMKKEIITSDVDGNPEVVKDGETGLLVPARNVKKLAEAMVWMLENSKKAERMAKNAREYYKRDFDFDKIFAEKMLSLYNIEKERK